MKAMIFAAGLGTRLHPITENTPKALVTIRKISLLEILIRRLIKYGFRDLIINVHHFSDQVKVFLQKNNYFNVNIQISDETEKLLDTGGGLKKASWFFDDGQPFLLHNVDVLSDIDYVDLMSFHQRKNSIATLAVRKRSTSRYLLFDKSNRLCGWKNIKTGKEIIVNPRSEYFQQAFSGIHIVNPGIFEQINTEGKFSIIDIYLELARDHIISCYEHDKGLWVDLGTIENLREGENIIDRII